MDSTYVNGCIAVKEKSLLGDRIGRMCELGAEDAFRMLVESGFGGEAVGSVREFESLCAADAEKTDAFIAEYAPDEGTREYLLRPRDFRNATAFAKASVSGADPAPMLSVDGLVPRETMERCFSGKDFSALPGDLRLACEEAVSYIGEGGADGALIGAAFEKGLFRMLSRVCRGKLLRGFVTERADMENCLSVLRAPGFEEARPFLVEGGSLTDGELERISSLDGETCGAFSKKAIAPFLRACLDAREAHAPYTEAERMLSSFDTRALHERRFELKAKEPFLYYVLRRRAENEDVRIVFVCLLAGMDEKQIKARLRSAV